MGLCGHAVKRDGGRFSIRQPAFDARAAGQLGHQSQISDASQYRRDELWALPTRRGGDCEDFALLKKRELIRLGIPAERLLIATVLDRKYRGHAVLVVRTHRGDMVLDNLTNRVMRWERTGYTFMKMQNPARPDTWQAILAGGLLADKADKSTASTRR